MEQQPNWKTNIKAIINDLVLVALILGIIFLLPPFIRFFWPFIIGWIIAMMANPLVRFLERKLKIKRRHSSAIIIIVVLAAIIVGLYFGINALVHEGMDFSKNLPSLFENMIEQLKTSVDTLHTKFPSLPDSIVNFFDNFGEKVSMWVNSGIHTSTMPTLSDASNIVKNVAEAFLMAIILILSAYFFTADKDKIVDGIKKKMSPKVLKHYNLVVGNVMKAVGGYLIARLEIMLIIFVILVIGLSILGSGYVFVIALIIAFLDFLPVFGTGTIFWPWAIYDLVTGQFGHFIGIMVIYLICQLTHQLLQPKLVGNSIGLDSLTTLIFLFVGYRFGGVLGMIVAIPIGMIIISFYRNGAFDQIIKSNKLLIKNLNSFRKI